MGDSLCRSTAQRAIPTAISNGTGCSELDDFGERGRRAEADYAREFFHHGLAAAHIVKAGGIRFSIRHKLNLRVGTERGDDESCEFQVPTDCL